jgi:acyl-CoA thioester hydrolase
MHYLAWFELGRTELLRTAGAAYSKIEQEGVMLPVSHVEVEYRSPVRYDEVVDIYTRVSRMRSRTVTFAYLAVRAETGEEVATGSTRLVCTDDEGKPRRIPPHLMDVLESLMATVHQWPDE